MRLPSQIARLNAITRFAPKNARPSLKPGRVFDSCPFECPFGHSLRKCKHFLTLKEECTTINYISSVLNPEDAAGFCAAGIIPYCRKNGTIYMFMLIEERRSVLAANFVGGGRETLRDPQLALRPETYIETAVSEFSEEVGDLIGLKHDFVLTVVSRLLNCSGPILWTGKSKYVALPIEVSPRFMDTVHLQPMVSDKSEAQNFEWIDIAQLHETLIHGFTLNILQFVLENLDVFFKA